jgi:hypothetical protein
MGCAVLWLAGVVAWVYRLRAKDRRAATDAWQEAYELAHMVEATNNGAVSTRVIEGWALQTLRRVRTDLGSREALALIRDAAARHSRLTGPTQPGGDSTGGPHSGTVP